MRCLVGWEAEETLERGKVLTPPSDTTNRCTALESGSEWNPSPVTETRERAAAWEALEDEEEEGGGRVLSEGRRILLMCFVSVLRRSTAPEARPMAIRRLKEEASRAAMAVTCRPEEGG